MTDFFRFVSFHPFVSLFWCLKVLLLFVFLHRLRLFFAAKKKIPQLKNRIDFAKPPLVCVQIPLFNEAGHISELLSSVGHQNWANFEVQVLDDSTDDSCFQETKLAVENARLLFPNLKIELHTRHLRAGYKAGALNEGLKKSNADFFAIFDCDFRPEEKFIAHLMSKFLEDNSYAAVQAPWSFYNDSENMLTCIQSVLLGNHFHVEHLGRENEKWFLNFNGTAGIWKRSALESLGGWSAETVTEDLHLSLRSHLKGNRVKYAPELACASELPANFNAFLVQQRRWSKGHGQVLRLMFGEIWKNRSWSLFQKHDAIAHLTSYFVSSFFFLAIFLLPFWIPENANWIQATKSSSPLRVFDTGLWILFFSCLWLYYLVPEISPGKRLKARVKSCFALAHAAPYLSLLVFPSFFVGLFSKNKKNLEFHRTPKRIVASRELGRQMKQSFRADTFVLAGFFVFLAYCVFVAARAEAYFTLILLGSNLVVVLGWNALQFNSVQQLMSLLNFLGTPKQKFENQNAEDLRDPIKNFQGNTDYESQPS